MTTLTFTRTRVTVCGTRELPSSDQIQYWCLNLGGMLRKARGLGESDATVTCVPVNLRIRNETTIPILSSSPPQPTKNTRARGRQPDYS
jgi:hypothetical protein